MGLETGLSTEERWPLAARPEGLELVPGTPMRAHNCPKLALVPEATLVALASICYTRIHIGTNLLN